MPRREGQKDCARECTYPSECRWGKIESVDSPVTTWTKTYEAYSPPPPRVSPKTKTREEKPRSSIFLDKLIKAAERKSAALKAAGGLSPVEEEEARSSTSRVRSHHEPLQLQFPTLTSNAPDGEEGPEDVLMEGNDSDGEERKGLTFDFATVNAFDSVSYAERSPTSPGRRNAWDWSVDTPDDMVLGDELGVEEGGFWDVEMV